MTVLRLHADETVLFFDDTQLMRDFKSYPEFHLYGRVNTYLHIL